MSEHHGKIWWNELVTSDLDGARAYYEALMGWSSEIVPMADGGSYCIFKNGTEMVAGAFAKTAEMAGIPDNWTTYLAVSDVEAAVAATQKAGGQVLQAPFDVPNVGRIAMLADPTGAAFGVMAPAAQG